MNHDTFTMTVLGCSGTYPEPGGSCSSYLLRKGGRSVLLDCGPGAISRLQEHVSLADLSGIVISHVHPDHWLDLPVLRNALRYVLDRRDVPVLAPREVAAEADRLFTDRHLTFSWTDVHDGDEADLAGLRFRFSRTDHPPETLACRVTDGSRSLGYSADTGPGWSMREFGERVDLALWEATFVRDAPEAAHHCDAADVGRLARQAGVGRLVLTHLMPGTDAAESRRVAEEAFGGEVEVAVAGSTYTV